MKTIKYLFQLVLISLVLGGATSCARDFEEPPLIAPEFTPSENSVHFSIEDLKTKYKDVADPVLIDMDIYLKAQVVGNDISGNIFKQLYVQDATGGIQLGVDQNNVAAVYGVGQEVYIMLHGMYILKYGNEFQLGFKGTNANRIPWEKFKEFVHRNGFAKSSNATPKVIPMSLLDSKVTPAAELDKLVNTLVTFEKMYFVNGGPDSLFIRKANGTTEDPMKDALGNVVIMRTSSYATPFVGKYLPYGNGKVTGILGRHNGTWQFMVRDLNDVKDSDFDGKEPEVAPKPEGDIFRETFGEGFYPSGSRPKIDDFKDGDMKDDANIKYSDRSKNADIRSMSGKNGAHVWLPAGKESYFTIEGIDSKDQTNLVLSFELAANLYDAGASGNLNAIEVEVNGQPFTIPSTPVSKAAGDDGKFYSFTFENFPSATGVKVEFISKADKNTIGFRLDNIVVGKKEDVIIPQ